MKKQDLENIQRKEENAGNQQFLLFLNVFDLVRDKSQKLSHTKMCVQNVFNLDNFNFLLPGKALTLYQMTNFVCSQTQRVCRQFHMR